MGGVQHKRVEVKTFILQAIENNKYIIPHNCVGAKGNFAICPTHIKTYTGLEELPVSVD